MEIAGLGESLRKPVRTYSKGMKRILALSTVLASRSKLLVLDEPTTGLDPQGRHIVWDKIRILRKQGVTIILTTHYMDEATALCDRVLIMENGKIIEKGTPQALIRKHVGQAVLEVEYDEQVVATLKVELPDSEIEVLGEQVRVFLKQPHGVFERVAKKFPSKTLTIRSANLEDVFLKLTGRKLE